MINFVGICLAMLASLAAGVFVQPIVAAGPLVIWLIAMAAVDWWRRHNAR